MRHESIRMPGQIRKSLLALHRMRLSRVEPILTSAPVTLRMDHGDSTCSGALVRAWQKLLNSIDE